MTDNAAAIRLTIPRPAPEIVKGYQGLATTAIADIIDLSCVVRYAIHPLWTDIPRIAGPAFTVRTAHHDNLMLHAAIYRAEPGDVIVVEAGDDSMAVAGGNVCAIAQKRGVAGIVIDGVIRDIGESRANGFPLFARGRSPIPAAKEGPGEINHPIRCGGVVVNPGDVVVADDEGIVVIPLAKAEEVLKKAQAKADADAKQSLDAWEKNHRSKVDATLKAKGYIA
ncbi:MAG TPA: RraA family protein [Candidatus Bathyarchaeia archaeon]|nr:RraA family protein [Candidatus Bathyarchaeia archaeon]